MAPMACWGCENNSTQRNNANSFIHPQLHS